MPSRILVGTAGWTIPASQRPAFGSQGTVLTRYGTRLDFTEINSSFYRPHQRKTYERWAGSAPDAFRFSVKLPRSITHDARLQDHANLLVDFLDQCSGLGSKLAFLLVQLPPSLQFDLTVAAAFFGCLRGLAGSVGIACEPRHPSWQTAAAEQVFRTHAVDRVAADPSLLGRQVLMESPPDWRYARLHGSPVVYRSRYDHAFLETLARRVGGTDTLRDQYIVFDNTAQGFALENALELRRLVHARDVSPCEQAK